MPLSNLPFHLDVEAALATVTPLIRRTPVLRVPGLEERGGPRLFLKMENLQVTGSFKVRGAANRLSSLSPEERDRGVVTCSSGNHGRAVAHIAGVLGVPALVCVPKWVDAVKLAVAKAGERAKGAVLASDAFFPFPDGVEVAARAGVTAVVQPGGSVRDRQVIETADQLELAMCFTGVRHFRH